MVAGEDHASANICGNNRVVLNAGVHTQYDPLSRLGDDGTAVMPRKLRTDRNACRRDLSVPFD